MFFCILVYDYEVELATVCSPGLSIRVSSLAHYVAYFTFVYVTTSSDLTEINVLAVRGDLNGDFYT